MTLSHVNSRRNTESSTPLPPPIFLPHHMRDAALGMAHAASHAIFGLSRAKLCSIYGPSRLLEDLIAIRPLSGVIPTDLLLDRWSWCDIDTVCALLLVTLESRILDQQRLAAQISRGEYRATELRPSRWRNITLPFETKYYQYSGSLSRRPRVNSTNDFFTNNIRLLTITLAK